MGFISGDLLDETPVDLDGIKRKILDVRKRTIPCAKIIDGQAHTHAEQLRDQIVHHSAFADQKTFGDLKLQCVWRDLQFADDFRYQFEETPTFSKLPVGNV